VTFEVRFSHRALADIDETLGWFSQRSSGAGDRWRRGLLAKIKTLEESPDAWPFADEAAELGLELRELPYGRRRYCHRILFTIDGQVVNIVRVRHSARDRLGPDDF
jgi:plasmid stabilization system protein ParE